MNEADYLKCLCQICGGSIEFPSDGIGERVKCPHCGEQTELNSTPVDAPPKPGGKFAVVAGTVLILCLLTAAAVMLFWRMKPEVSAPNIAMPVVTNAAVPETFTELNDFKVGRITLKKTEGSGLVYAVGTVKNDTSRQRFGVRIQVEMLDDQDNKIGSASDYIEVLQPGKDWQFKALLTDPKTVRATLINVEEQK